MLLALIAIDGADSAGPGEPLRPVRIKVLGSSLGVKSWNMLATYMVVSYQKLSDKRGLDFKYIATFK